MELSSALRLRVAVEAPELSLADVLDADATGATWPLARLESLQVSEARLRLHDRDLGDEPWLDLEDVALDALLAGSAHRIALHTRRGRVLGESVDAIDADLTLEPGALRVVSASVLAGASFARMEGAIALDAGLARRLDPRLALEGAVEGDGSLRVDAGTMALDTQFRSEELSWKRAALRHMEGEAHFESGVLVVPSLAAEGFGGQARLSARIAFEEDTESRLELSWEGVDAGKAVHAVTSGTLPLSLRLGGHATLTLAGLDTGTVSAEGRAFFEPGSDVLGTIEGTLAPDGGLEATYAVRLEDVSELLPFRSSGSITAAGAVEGPVANPRWRALLDSRDLSIENEAFQLTGQLAGTLQEAETLAITIEGTEGRLSLDGVIPFATTTSWDIAVQAERFPLVWGIDADGEASIFGPARHPDWSATLHLSSPDGDVTLTAKKSGREIRVEELSGRMGSGKVRASGRFALDGRRLDGTFSLERFRPSTFSPLAGALHGFDGALSLDGSLRGSWPEPNLTATVGIDDVSFRETPLPSLRFSFFTEEGALHFRGLRVDGAELAEGTVALTEKLPLRATIHLDALPLTALVGSIPLELEREHAAWSAEGAAVIDVSLRDPSDLALRAHVASLSAQYGDSSARAEDFEIGSDGRRLRLTGFELRGAENHLSIEGEIPLTETSRFDLDVRAGLKLGFVETLVPALQMDGEASVDLNVHGTMEDPDVLGELGIRRGSGRFERVTWDNLRLRASIDENRFREIALTAELLGGAVSMEGGVPRPIAFRVDEVDLGPLLLETGACIVSLSGGVEAAAAGRLDLAVVGEIVALPGLHVRGGLTVDMAASRRDGRLSLEGRGALSDGRLVSLDPSFVLSDVSGRFELADEALLVRELTARAGTGVLNASGRVDLKELLSNPVFDLQATAEGVPLELMDGFRSELSGEIALVSRNEELELRGSLAIDRSLLTRELDDDDASFSAQSILLADPTAETGLLSRLALDVVVTTSRNIVIENSTARLEAAGSIAFRGTLAAPELSGFVNLVPDGTFTIGRNRFQVIQGRVDLTGFPAVPPNLQLSALTRVGTTAIQADIEGDTDDLRTRLSSPENPDLTEGDLASLLITGRTLENAGQGGQQMASTWMMSSLANLVHEGLGELISFGPPPGAGPLILAEEADPTARLTVGFPVTERVSITYSIALDDSERRLWILDYRIARNVWLRAIQEDANDYSFGLSQRFSLDLRQPERRSVASDEVRISRITFRGVGDDLARKVELTARERYDYWKVRDEARRLERTLVEAGHLGAVVEVESRIEEADPNAVSLSFVAEPGPLIEIRWRGEDPGDAVKKRFEPSWDGRIPEEFLLADLAERVRVHLRAERYYLDRAEASIEDHDGKRTVLFDVRRGSRGRSVELAFEGNTVLSDEELAATLPKTGTADFFLLLEKPSELERGLRLRYASEGYLDASIGEVATRFDWAEALNARPDDETVRWHFSFGYAF